MGNRDKGTHNCNTSIIYEQPVPFLNGIYIALSHAVSRLLPGLVVSSAILLNPPPPPGNSCTMWPSPHPLLLELDRHVPRKSGHWHYRFGNEEVQFAFQIAFWLGLSLNLCFGVSALVGTRTAVGIAGIEHRRYCIVLYILLLCSATAARPRGSHVIVWFWAESCRHSLRTSYSCTAVDCNVLGQLYIFLFVFLCFRMFFLVVLNLLLLPNCHLNCDPPPPAAWTAPRQSGASKRTTETRNDSPRFPLNWRVPPASEG
jgi:hypothetical protein